MSDKTHFCLDCGSVLSEYSIRHSSCDSELRLVRAKLKIAVDALEEIKSNGRVGVIAMDALTKIRETS